MNNCSRCGKSCDGSIVRTNPNHTRVSDMLTDNVVPKLPNGGIALCHTCQRSVQLAKGYLLLLAKDLIKEAEKTQNVSDSTCCPHCGNNLRYKMKARNRNICMVCEKQYSDKSTTPYRSSKLSMEKIKQINAALKTMSINAAAKSCKVQYRTAWRIKQIQNESI